MLEIKNVSKSYRKQGWFGVKKDIQAVKNINIKLKEGICLALVGESGSGKTTLGKLILGIEEPDAGEILFKARNIHKADAGVKKQLRKELQIVFQDCYSAVNPRMKIKDIIAEPMQVHLSLSKEALQQKIEELLVQVGLQRADAAKFPHELSGGQLQRVTIARAISTDPSFIVLDESINSLDLLVQVSILKLLKTLQKTQNLSYLFITHDLHAVKLFADEVAVMEQGEIIEYVTDIKELSYMEHPTSRRLLDARLSIKRDVSIQDSRQKETVS
ncbi:dipeptide/oligopeptide/nickel ABC transporter ATP-binding protein [Domibacillus sp. 8LH]|uniref:ABC transporter ATP-binding protein n=1 Tax=Domibacillus sp. 8LH TaxID=3073900 RepID=UPI00316F5EC3